MPLIMPEMFFNFWNGSKMGYELFILLINQDNEIIDLMLLSIFLMIFYGKCRKVDIVASVWRLKSDEFEWLVVSQKIW